MIFYILGGVSLLLLCIGAIGYYKFIRPIRNTMKLVKETTGMDLSDLEDSPLVNLMYDLPDLESDIEGMDEVSWGAEGAINDYKEKFVSQGFEKVGIFAGVSNFGEAEVFVDSDGKILLIGETEDGERAKLRILGVCEDESYIYVSNNDVPSLIPPMKCEKRIQRNAEKAVNLLEDFNDLRADRALIVVTKSTVIEELKKLEKKRCWYIASNPSVIDDLLDGVDDKSGMFLTSIRQSLADLISECCRDEYLEKADHSAREWEEMRDDVVIVHDRSLAGSLIDELPEVEGISTNASFEALLQLTNKSMTREDYVEHLSKLSEGSRPKLIGNVSKPIAADIYLK